MSLLSGGTVGPIGRDRKTDRTAAIARPYRPNVAPCPPVASYRPEAKNRRYYRIASKRAEINTDLEASRREDSESVFLRALKRCGSYGDSNFRW